MTRRAQRSPVADVRLYIITDPAAVRGRDLVAVIDDALAGVPAGVAAIQLRDRAAPTRDLLSQARALRRVTRARASALLINDRLDIALAVGADGVHVPERGLDIADVRALAGPAFVIGVSTHDPEGAAAAVARGADLVVLGPIWATPSKARFGPPLGTTAIASARAAVSRAAPDSPARLLALGGVTSAERAHQAVRAGADGVAGIRAVMAAERPAVATRAFYDAIARAHGTLS